jgi:hypothetical protein
MDAFQRPSHPFEIYCEIAPRHNRCGREVEFGARVDHSLELYVSYVNQHGTSRHSKEALSGDLRDRVPIHDEERSQVVLRRISYM